MEFEPALRLGGFFGVLALLAILELRSPRRAQRFERWLRWPSNFGIVVVDTLVSRLVFPAAAVGAAVYAEGRGWGLLNRAALPDWLEILVAIVALDLVIYAQHVLFHRVPTLWRLHRVHHADLEFDVTTGIRFHPIEILLSMAIKLGAVVILGAPALGVLIFEVLLNAAAMFNHSNLKLPIGVDRVLRRVLVTPDMHRVHHSIVVRETHSNFGFALPWWDRLFRTYRAQPVAGHDGMTIGVPEFRDRGELRLDRMLMQPLRRGRTQQEE